MEIKRTSRHSLSIYLLATDLEELGITYESMDHHSPHTRLAIQQLLETALAQTGFDPQGHKLLIEAYPVEDDGCLLFFTLSDLIHKEERVRSAEPTLFLFSSFRQLCQACHKLTEVPPSALYWQNNQYILAITINGELLPAIKKQLSSYGQIAADSTLLLADLQEHESCLLAERAIEQLCQYF